MLYLSLTNTIEQGFRLGSSSSSAVRQASSSFAANETTETVKKSLLSIDYDSELFRVIVFFLILTPLCREYGNRRLSPTR